jgi:hypothetical protein
MTTSKLHVVAALLAAAAPARADRERSFAGSIQLDYLAAPTEAQPRQSTLDGATVELSLKMTVDFSKAVSANVKVCFACHGFEAGMAYVELRQADELRLRVGRMTPSFGAFPVRHDPANHGTSDKPLPYDMGRMLRLREWNEGVLPAPWVDNGIELDGTHFFHGGQVDYAAFLITGPKGDDGGTDFDFVQSRNPQAYYVDNNSQPTGGARLSGTIELAEHASVTAGASGMAGHYDPAARLGFAIAGADLAFQLGDVAIRGEYLIRWTQIGLGDNPATQFKYGPDANGHFADYFVKDGFYVETEIPIGHASVIARWDGLRRDGNVLATSPLRSLSEVLRYTGAFAYRMSSGIRLKASVEYYDFSDFNDDVALHVGLATAF